MLDHIRIVLCQPTHPGNIGAVARAMKNMGLTRLYLVEPQNYPHIEATSRASGADDILEKAVVCDIFEDAIKDCQWVFGTSARSREFPWPQLSPKAASHKAMDLSLENQIAFVFGQERAGMTNEQLQRCDYHLCIPTSPGYASLNLAAAVQVITYEIFQAFLAIKEEPPLTQPFAPKATQEEIAGLLSHFEAVSIQAGFMDPAHPKKLLPRVKRLFSKAHLEQEEINILRGFLKMVSKK